MIECGLFAEALESVQSALFPGLLPPVTYLCSLLEYAQQVGSKLPDCRNSHLLLQHKPQGLYESIKLVILYLLLYGVLFWDQCQWNKLEFRSSQRLF